MKLIAIFALSILLFAASCGGNNANQSGQAPMNAKPEPTASNAGNSETNIKSTYVRPVKIDVQPEMFRKGDQIGVNATFTPGPQCQKSGMAVRVHEIGENDGEPIYGGANETPFLVQSAPNAEPALTPGTQTQVAFEPLSIPANSGANLYVVVWNWCETRISKGIDKDGNIIWEIKMNGSRVGSAKYKFQCPGGPDQLCAYRPA